MPSLQTISLKGGFNIEQKIDQCVINVFSNYGACDWLWDGK